MPEPCVQVDERGLYTGSISDDVISDVLAAVASAEEGFHRWTEADRPQRSTINYGWSFVALEKGEREWIAPPEAVLRLRGELFEIFHAASSDAAAGRLAKPEDIDNIIITIYNKGDSIVPHYDRAEDPAKSYHFGDSVFGVVLQPSDTSEGIFWQRNDSCPGSSLTMADAAPEVQPKETKGFSFMMQSAMRNWPYYHGVIPASSRRISLTARVTVMKDTMKQEVKATEGTE